MSAKLMFALYSKDAGVEILPETKVNGEKKTAEGRVQMRFFLLKSPGAGGKITQIKFMLEPFEAFDLHQRMLAVYSSATPIKDKLVHKFKHGDVEISTTLSIEKWTRGDKSGLGLAIGRGDGFISVPVAKDCVPRFVFAAEFLRAMSVRQSWIDCEAA